MNPSNEPQVNTTATAGAAGSAVGGIVGFGLAALTGVDTAPIAVPLGIVGAFTFGLIFPGK